MMSSVRPSDSVKWYYNFGMFKATSKQMVKSTQMSFSETYEKSTQEISYDSAETISSSSFLNAENNDDLFLKIRWFLMFGRAIGLIPCKGVFQKDFNHYKFRFKSLAAFTTTFMTGALLFSFILGAIGMFRSWKRNASELAFAAADPCFYFIGLFTVGYFLKNGHDFAKLFPKWSKMKFHMISPDTTLSKHAGLLSVAFMTSAILENIVWTLKPIFELHEDTPKESALITYYKGNHGNWYQVLPYHEVLVVLAFISNKVCIYTWNFLDLLIAIISRAIYMKFKMLYEAAECVFPKDNETGRRLVWGNNPQIVWNKLIQDHSTVCDIILEFQDFLSPLIFLTYSANIYFGCLQLLHEFSPKKTEDVIKSLYISWSFIHLLIRAFVMSYMAAKVNEYAHKFSEILGKCPEAFYSSEMERFERKLYLTDIGFNGLGCFVITKPLNLGIIGVILTFEIVLLQSLPHNSGGNLNCPSKSP